MTNSYKGSGQPERARIDEYRPTYPSDRERYGQHSRRRHVNAVPPTLRGATAEETHYLLSAIENNTHGINWGHIASVIRLSSKPNMSSKETARTRYTGIRERVTAPGPCAQEDSPIGTQDLSFLTLNQLQERLKKLDKDVATIDLEREAVMEEILIKEVMKRDDAKIEAEEEKLKNEKKRLREKAKQEIKNVKKRVATEEADGQAEAKKKRIEEEKLNNAAPFVLSEKVKQEGGLREKAKQEAINGKKRMTREVAGGDVDVKKEMENIEN